MMPVDIPFASRSIHIYIYIQYCIGTGDYLLILFEMFDSLVIWAFGFPLQLQEEQQKRLSEHSTESEDKIEWPKKRTLV